jgi:hypothetical protein
MAEINAVIGNCDTAQFLASTPDRVRASRTPAFGNAGYRLINDSDRRRM